MLPRKLRWYPAMLQRPTHCLPSGTFTTSTAEPSSGSMRLSRSTTASSSRGAKAPSRLFSLGERVTEVRFDEPLVEAVEEYMILDRRRMRGVLPCGTALAVSSPPVANGIALPLPRGSSMREATNKSQR